MIMGMGMVTTAAEREIRGPIKVYQPRIRGFMDDLTVTATIHMYRQDGSYKNWKIAFPGQV